MAFSFGISSVALDGEGVKAMTKAFRRPFGDVILKADQPLIITPGTMKSDSFNNKGAILMDVFLLHYGSQ